MLLIALLVAIGAPHGAAQPANLLRNGDFEAAFPAASADTAISLPEGWDVWIAETRTDVWMNQPPQISAHGGPDPAPQRGDQAVRLRQTNATFSAALYQQVTVPADVDVQAGAYAYLHTCTPDPADAADARCPSSPESGAFVRIGIDPAGGTNPIDPAVIWSATARPHDAWAQLAVSATAAGDTVTIFLNVSQQWPTAINRVYWDDAVLLTGDVARTVGEAASGALVEFPALPPAAESADQPEAAEPSYPPGTLIHVVQPGETLDSVAIDYGLTRADLLERNTIPNPSLIRIGQPLVIRFSETERQAASTPGDLGRRLLADPPRVDPIAQAQPAPVVSAETGAVAPSIDPAPQRAAICALIFEDLNQNRLWETSEARLAGGLLTVRSPVINRDHTTTGADEPVCFADLTAGAYVAAATAPPGYGLTTPDQLQVRALPGETITVTFGAAPGLEPVALPAADPGALTEVLVDAPAARRTLPFFDILGLLAFGLAGVTLVFGLGIALLLRRR
ncbi:MAG: LysM peptidoglycan-binding domain-containing protein [Chloroflexi bacterium]|nr:LysM peptidoglycan-binding domain-containing protein [Chloroflexota bacterium]